MISDFVKGKKQFDFPGAIQKGIRLHRAIDTYADEHESTHRIKEIFRPYYGLYAAPITDVVYDYFVANDRTLFLTQNDLYRFTLQTYQLLHTRKEWMGLRFGALFPYMEAQNWLYYYKDTDGIAKSLEGLRRRATYLGDMEKAFKLFLENRSKIEEAYNEYFFSVKKMAQDFLANPLS